MHICEILIITRTMKKVPQKFVSVIFKVVDQFAVLKN